jgi:putative ABC transport system permease protein
VTLGYLLRLALKSLRRHPGHTAIMVLAFTLGLAAWTAARSILRERSSDAFASRRGLYYVSIPRERGDLREQGGVELATFRDRVLLESSTPARRTDMFQAMAAASADGGPISPAVVILCTRDLFEMLGIPIRSGAVWSAAEGAGEERPVVLTERAERALFAGASGVGRTLRLFGEPFRVAGVVAIPTPPGARAPREAVVFAPSAVGIALGVRPRLVFEREELGGSFEALTASTNGWLTLLVVLDDERRRAAFQAELDAHVERERARGARIFPAELVPRARDHARRAADAGTTLFTLLADAVLAACTLNLARLLEGKLRAKRAEIAVLRAFGASARDVLLGILLEAGLVAAGSAALALGVAAGALAVVNRVIQIRPVDYHLDMASVAAAIGGAVVVGLAAGVYPAARAARRPPAEGLGRA